MMSGERGVVSAKHVPGEGRGEGEVWASFWYWAVWVIFSILVFRSAISTNALDIFSDSSCITAAESGVYCAVPLLHLL